MVGRLISKHVFSWLLLIGTLSAPPLLSPAAAVAQSPDSLVWLDRSSGALDGASAIAVAPDDPRTIYAAAHGVVAVSTNGGASWKPTLLLFGRSTEDASTLDLFEADSEELQSYDELDVAARFESIQDDLLDELVETYGEEVAEQLLLEMRDEISDDALQDILDDADLTMNEVDYANRLQQLRTAGLDDDNARELAGGRFSVWRLVTDPEQPAALYAATGAGLYRSLDRGRRWQRLLDGIGASGQSVTSVATSRQGQRIVAGTDAGLRVSDDAGRTWSSPTGGLSSQPVHTLLAASPERFYVATSGGLYLSDDAGDTWRELSLADFSPNEIRDLSSPAGQPDTLLAATTRGLFISNDAGGAWRWLTATGLDERATTRVALPREDLSLIYVTTPQRAFYSNDGGKQWKRLGDSFAVDVRDLVAVGPSLVWIAARRGILQSIAGDRLSIESETLRQLEAIWADEPTPADTLQAALIASNLDVLPQDRWAARARLRVFGPRVQFLYSYYQNRLDGEDINYRSSDADVDDDSALVREFATHDVPFGQLAPFFYRQGNDATIQNPQAVWELMFFWDLGDIVFNDADLTLEGLNEVARRSRQRLLKRVLKLLLKRRQLQLQMAAESASADLATVVDQRLHLDEYNALLNGLTGGFYLTALSRGRADVSENDRLPMLPMPPALESLTLDNIPSPR